MSVRILIVLLMFCLPLFVQAQSTADQLKGTWAGCDARGGYTELHVYDQYLAEHVFFEIDSLNYMVVRYKRCGDSILLSTRYELNCNTVDGEVKKLKIRISGDSLELAGEQLAKFKRISKGPLMNFLEKGHAQLEEEGYVKTFVKRKEDFGCSRQ